MPFDNNAAEEQLSSFQRIERAVIQQRALLDSYDPDHMPSTFVIDPNGIVRLVHYGYEKGDEKKVAAKLDALLK